MIALLLMTAVGAMAQTTYNVSVKDGTEDVANWSATPNPATEGETVTITYNGTKKVKSVKAVKKAGAIPGLFTVNPDGDKVYFSKGNLQYIGNAATPYWKFADNQWDYLSTNGSNATNVDRDLFGWGTSGSAPTGQTARAPYYTTQTNSDYVSNITTNGASWGENSEWDWGVNMGSGWRTLTKDEWTYVFNTRSTTTTNMPTGDNSSAARYTKATVAGVSGVILFPDNYAHPAGASVTVSSAGYNTGNKAYTTFTVDATNWAKMEATGCVFLPAAGYRNGASVNGADSDGYYWSSTAYYGTNYAYYVDFYSDGVDPALGNNRFSGLSVRLVRPVQ